jgi:hypothetical protein
MRQVGVTPLMYYVGDPSDFAHQAEINPVSRNDVLPEPLKKIAFWRSRRPYVISRKPLNRYGRVC